MSGMAEAVGLIGFIVIMSLVVAAYSPMFGSLHEDAVANGVINSTDNKSYNVGVGVANGFMGFDMGIVAIAFILLIIVVILLIWKL